MSLHHNNQMSGPNTIDMNDSGSAAEKAMLPVVLAISLRLYERKWQVNLNDGNGWKELSDQSSYTPPIRVRKVNICEASIEGGGSEYDSLYDSRTLEFNLAGNGEQMAKGTKENPNREFQEGIVETFRTNMLHDLHITKIYLANLLQVVHYTNATYIVLHG